MARPKRPTRAQKILLTKMGMYPGDWLVREHGKPLITLVNRHTGAEVIKYVPEVWT